MKTFIADDATRMVSSIPLVADYSGEPEAIGISISENPYIDPLFGETPFARNPKSICPSNHLLSLRDPKRSSLCSRSISDRFISSPSICRRSLLSYHKFADAKWLLVSYIRTSDVSLSLYNSLHHPSLHLSPPPSKAFFDISLGAYLQAGKPNVALQIFQKMIRFKLNPNLLIFFEGKIDDAIGMIERMISQFKVHPDVKELLLDMKRKGLVRNRETYNNLVYGYCKLGSLKEAF